MFPATKTRRRIITAYPSIHYIIHAMDTWKDSLEMEFGRAASARARGNEGQARVCARRAAGLAIREYLYRRGERVTTVSAYDLLNSLKDDPALPQDLLPLVEHLTLRVNEAFKLPVEADLVAEARMLCKALLPDWEM
jgi:hypothetical protein